MEQGPFEVTGRTVEEAVESGLQRLRIDRDDADVVVLSAGRSGILGIGSEPARVRVSVRQSTTPLHIQPDDGPVRDAEPDPVFVSDDEAERARTIVATLLELMNVEVEVDLYNPFTDPDASEVEAPIVLDLYGEDAGLLIGRRGATLQDLQSLVTTMVSRTIGHYIPLRLDVEGYQQRRLDRAQQLALRAAERVVAQRRPITLEPMSAAERRIVHTTLASNAEVQTQSSGDGENRQVTISLVGVAARPIRVQASAGGRDRSRGPGGGPMPAPPRAAGPPSAQQVQPPPRPVRRTPAFDPERGPMADDEDDRD